MDAMDQRLIDALQGGFPVAERPYAEVGARLGLDEAEVIARLQRLLDEGVLSRFGPMYDAERLGGAFSLAAMAVPDERFEAVTETVNAFPEVAHNYRRTHELNMWFVLASDRRERIAEVEAAIQAATGLLVLDLPKLEEYFLGLRLSA
jgi:siroheme decarboxylase